MEFFTTHWTAAQMQRLSDLLDQGVEIAYWNSDAYARPANGGTGNTQVYPGLVQEIPGPLKLCGSGALHATLHPHKWTGCRVWLVALFGSVQKEQNKLGALKREILGEILPEEAIFDAGLACRLGIKNFSGANLSRADLSRAYLSRADLSRANLSGAILSGANLYGANLSGAYRPYNPPQGWKIVENRLQKA